ncbi:FtsJ methyltransferase domain containing 1 [Chamberlinius hualienensis]
MNTEEVHEIEAQFNKSYILAQADESQKLTWKLPTSNRISRAAAWTNNELSQLKCEMNAIKEQLSVIDIEKWSRHTASLNKSKFVISRVREEIDPELCTQAWCKFYEILCKYPIVPYWKKLTSFNSGHLCEAPGAFITSLNHYLRLNFPHIKLTWLASSLNPYYEGNILQATVPDDRLIRFSPSCWCFGVDNTGDIFSKSNREYLCDKFSELGEIHLVTADGSVDCQNNPGEQESIVASLHVAEVVLALRVLAKNGNFVLKMFSFYEQTSVCLLYLLVCTFDQVHVFKPGTSSSGNSEVYVIALGYAGESFCREMLNVIDDSIGENKFDSTSIFFYEDIPSTFIDRVIECAKFFKKLQSETITENIKLFSEENQMFRKRRNKLKSYIASNFIVRYGMGVISQEQSIIGSKKLNAIERRQKPLSTGSFVDRAKSKEFSLIDKLKFLESQYAVLMPLQVDSHLPSISILNNVEKIPIHVTFGKEFFRCFTSAFCDVSVIIWHNQVIDCYKEICDVVSLMQPPKYTVSGVMSEPILSWIADNNFRQLVPYNATCMPLVDNLQKQISVSQNHSNSNCETRVVLADLNDDNIIFSYGAAFTQHILTNACDILKFLDLNDSLILLLTPMLTRVEVGILFIFLNSFEEFRLLSSPDGQSKGLAFCKRFKGSTKGLHLIVNELQRYRTSSSIVEIINVVNLLDEPFFSKVLNFNTEFILRQTKHLLRFLNSAASTTIHAV